MFQLTHLQPLFWTGMKRIVKVLEEYGELDVHQALIKTP